MNETEDDSSRRRTDPSDPNRRRDPSDPNRRRTDPSDPDRRRDPSDPNRRRRASDGNETEDDSSRRRTDPSDPNRRRDPSDPNRRRTDPSDPDRRRDPSDPDRRRRATVKESEARRRTDPADPNRRRDPADPNRRRTDAWDPDRRRDPADANRRRSSTSLLNEGTAQQAWDKAVAFYAGSRWDSRADAVMLDAEANMLCSLFGTCDEEDEGVSIASDKIFRHFESGQTALMQNECGNLTTDRDRIISLMYVPLIQNLLYASYKLATKMSNEEPLIQRDRGHGIFFAKAMQPKLASCAQDVADIVARNLLVPFLARGMLLWHVCPRATLCVCCIVGF